MSTPERETKDVVLVADATLQGGWGYGIWLRAGLGPVEAISGYTLQFDPGYGTENPDFGKAVLVRLWQDGKECETPLTRVPLPAGIEENATHRIKVVVWGQLLTASIDGNETLRIDNLSEQVSQSGCAMAEPTGKGVGYRTWRTSSAEFVNTTIE
jgi:hypothetical protein